MKYDSGMTHFHGDIIAALRYMLKDDSEITEKFSPKDGSPAPLRDYLKQKYGKLRASHIGDGMRYSCNFTKGLELTFGIILNNPGDKNLTLSWSQVTKFIRDNWDEVFKKDKPKSRPLETLVRTFDETEMTCPNWIKGKTLAYIEPVNGIHFECKAFSAEFCKLDDITKFFVQHCHKPQECPYCKDSTESKPAYKDIFLEHYPNFDVSRFDEFAESLCVACCFDDDGAECPYGAFSGECKKHWEDKCLFEWRDEIECDLETINEFLIEQPLENETAENAVETAVAVQDENTKVQAAFDYSELDGDTADKLRAVSEQVISIKATYIIETAKQVKIAHDLLANHYKGLFGVWCKSVGFSRDTGDNLVRVAEVFPEFNVAENFGNIKALLYEASKPSAPPELVEQVRNGDITTHKDYIALKKQLDEARSETENVKRDSEKNSAKLAAETAKADELKRNIEELNEKNTRLALEIVKLEKRPVDVIVDSNEVNKRVAEAVSKINSETEQTLAAREQEFAETLHFKDERIWALEDKLKELGGSTDADKKIFLLSMTDEDYRKMLAELNGSSFRNILEAAAVVDIK